MKKKIFVLVDYFLPGFKAGGPVRSISNIMNSLGDVFLFYIVTRDRDKEDIEPYQGIETDKWMDKNSYKVKYMSPSNRSIISIYRTIISEEFDLIYLNSFFSIFSIYTILIRRFGFLSKKPVVLAPRGEFSSGALQLKQLKKRIFIRVAMMFGMYNNIVFQASSEYEKKDIEKHFKGIIIVAPNIPSLHTSNSLVKKPLKEEGEVSFIFLSRISRKKNLHKALNLLNNIIDKKIIFDIYGPIDDKNYYKECESIILKLPKNIKCKYKGSVLHENVYDTLINYHFLFFPTLGENYGHVILEAMSSGCPVIISDQTPWRNLEKQKVGWDLSLDDNTYFIDVINECARMNNNEYIEMSENAIKYWNNIINDSEIVKLNKYLFNYALGKKT